MRSTTIYLTFVASIILLGFIIVDGSITGLVPAEDQMGCCSAMCQQTKRSECHSAPFYAGIDCTAITDCDVGCCVTEEGYCMANYLKGNCEGDFAYNDCTMHRPCLTEPNDTSRRGYTGFEMVYEPEDRGRIFTEPFTGQVGDIFTVKMQLFEEAQDLKVKITHDDHEETIRLYDDGNHRDGLSDDDLYANVWDSGRLDLDEISNIRMTAFMDGEESGSAQLLISPDPCIPLKMEGNGRDVIFAGSFSMRVMSYIQEISDADYFMVNGSRSSAESACEFYDPHEDMIIMVDNDTSRCHQEQGYVELNPLFHKNRDSADSLEELFEDFCRYIYTEEDARMMAEEIMQEPEVELILPMDNETYNASVEFYFSAMDNSDNLEYAIYVDGRIVFEDITANNEPVFQTLDIVDGKHDVWVEVEDSHGNYGISNMSRISVNRTGFVINITNLDTYEHDASPEIEFVVYHRLPVTINYTLVADGADVEKGSVIPGNETTIETDMGQGHHDISVIATDGMGNMTISKLYKILIN